MKNQLKGKVKRVIGLVIMGLVLANFQANAASYYFSSVNGSDSNDGSSPSSAWKSVSKLQSVVKNIKAGDIIYLERGSEWDMVRLKLLYKSGTASSNIVFKAYGSGPKPILSGKKKIGTMSKSGNVWSITDYDLSDYSTMRILPGLFLNNTWYKVGRTPNTGYYSTNTTGTDTYLEDYSQSFTTDEYKGGTMVARTEPWQWDKGIISGNGSGSFNLWSPGFMYDLHYDKTYYFIQNHNNCLDVDGEWAYDFGSNKLSVYYSGDLNSQDVKFTAVDTMITMDHSSYIRFEDIHFTGINLYAMYIEDGGEITIDNCKFDYIGKTTIKAKKADNFFFTNNEVKHIFRNGIMFNYNGRTYVSNNTFDNIGIVPGHESHSEFANQAISYFRQQGEIRIQRNKITNVVYGVCGFENMAPVYVEENFVQNYGMELGDGGAYYNAHDSFPVPKYIRKNIALDGYGDQSTYYSKLGLIHAIYHDYDCRNFIVDSNSVMNTNYGLLTNRVANCKFRYNNIYKTGQYMNKDWRYSLYQGNRIGVTYITNNEIKYNQIVHDPMPEQYVYAPHQLDEKRGNDYDYNYFITPFDSKSEIFRTVASYTPGPTYSLPEWIDFIGHESHSSHLTDIKYDESLGVAKDDYVKFLYNWSENDEMQPLDGVYKDKDGNLYYGEVLVPAYYSVILFFVEEREFSNNAPTILDQSFQVEQAGLVSSLIGNITATDADSDQNLSYAIISGNEDGLFTITANGALQFAALEEVSFAGNPEYNLIVRVTDDGTPSRTADAEVTVNLISDGGFGSSDNNPPQLLPQSFNGNFDMTMPSVLGMVEASDSDEGQTLSYSIVSGNQDNLFTLDAKTGELSLVSLPSEWVPATYNLVIAVEDDGDTPLVTEASITVLIMASEKVYYINPQSVESTQDGSYEYPFTSWSQVTWENDATYLQKRGTIADEDKILVTAQNIILGDYGSGSKPYINSHASDYAIKAIDKGNITIKNLVVDAENAIGCVYFIGESCINNTLENCELTGADYGLRIIDGGSYKVKYNMFNNKVDAIYSIAESAEIYYNVFKGNHKALNISSYSSIAKVYNNVFYDNRQGISATYAELTLYNNIFYMTQSGDQAINHSLDKLVSNNNIFYPEQSGFIEIAEVQYDDIDEYRQNHGLDLQSLTKDPLFVDVYVNNFSVMEESRAIDAGRIVGLTQDFLGQKVPFGNSPDIGHVEAKTEARVVSSEVPQFDVESPLSVYPNPSDGIFTLQIEDLKAKQNVDVSIFSLNGKQVYSNVFEGQGKVNSEIDISMFPKGVYIISVKLRDSILTQKLIVE